MQYREFTVRLDDAAFNALEAQAKKLGVARAVLARNFISAGLDGYDTKHEELLRRSEQIQATLMDVLEIAGVSAALMIKLDAPQMVDNEKIRSKLKDGFESAQVVMRSQQVLKNQKQGK